MVTLRSHMIEHKLETITSSKETVTFLTQVSKYNTRWKRKWSRNVILMMDESAIPFKNTIKMNADKIN